MTLSIPSLVPLPRKRSDQRAQCGIVTERQVGGARARGAGRERDRYGATGVRRKRTRASAAFHKVVRVRTGDADTADGQRRCSGVAQGHALRAGVANLDRPEIQARRIKADHGRRQRDLLRAAGSIVSDFEVGRNRAQAA